MDHQLTTFANDPGFVSRLRKAIEQFDYSLLSVFVASQSLSAEEPAETRELGTEGGHVCDEQLEVPTVERLLWDSLIMKELLMPIGICSRCAARAIFAVLITQFGIDRARTLIDEQLSEVAGICMDC